MVKQLYYSEIHSKNIEIYLSKLYTGKYYEVNDVLIISRGASGCFCDVIS